MLDISESLIAILAPTQLLPTRTIGKRLLNEPNLSHQQREIIEDELTYRIGLMRQIRNCDPKAIFHYNSKGFISFTSEYREILQRDLSDWPRFQSKPGSEWLQYDRSMLELEARDATMRQRVVGRLRADDARLEAQQERRLREREIQERRARERGEQEAYAREMWARDERERMRRYRDNQEERKAREREEQEAYAREMRARDERKKRIREREEADHVRDMEERAREARERDTRDSQRLRGSRPDSISAGRQTFEPEHRAQRGVRRNTYDKFYDHELDKRIPLSNPPPRVQTSSVQSREQGSHNARGSAPLRRTQSSNRPPSRSQSKTASTQTISRAPLGGKQSQPQKNQPPRTSKTPDGPPPGSGPSRVRQSSPPSAPQDQIRDEAGAPLEWDDQSAWHAVGSPEYW